MKGQGEALERVNDRCAGMGESAASLRALAARQLNKKKRERIVPRGSENPAPCKAPQSAAGQGGG